MLGCTHYPLLRDVIGDFMGPDVALLDSGAEVARAVARWLREHDLAAAGQAGQREWYVSDTTDGFSALASIFLGRPVTENVTQVAVGAEEGGKP